MGKTSAPFLDIGIDGIGFYAPRQRLRAEDLATSRHVDPEKYINGLMLKEFAVPDYGEDSVSMALMAATHALRRSRIDPKDIDGIFVGTETSVYAVKSIASILAGTLGISENAFTGDLSHACASATYSVLNAIGLIQTGLVEKALVVGTDISKYPLKSPGEPTQGAGAVALILSKKPRIARFSSNFGKISGHVNDFFRPHGQDTAIVYGRYSVDAYLTFQQHAHDNLYFQAPFDPDYWILHSPYAKLPVKFFRQLLVRRWLKDPAQLQNLLKSGPVVPRFTDTSSILAGDDELPPKCIFALKKAGYSEEDVVRINFLLKTQLELHLHPSLQVSRHFGNIYSASVWAQLQYVLENHASPGDLLYFGSYGSGATAISGLLKVLPEAPEIVSRGPQLSHFIQQREYISVDEYERRHSGKYLYRPTLSFARIQDWYDTHRCETGSDTKGLSLSFCDCGCILPHNPELSYCPEGHFGRVKKDFPLSGLIQTTRRAIAEDPLWTLAHTDEVPVLGPTKPGERVELNFRRLREGDNKLIQWAPVYVPTAIKHIPILVKGDLPEVTKHPGKISTHY